VLKYVIMEEPMRANATINAMGPKEDVQKLWDALSEPNEYGGGPGF
jgi:hypothetical protein